MKMNNLSFLMVSLFTLLSVMGCQSNPKNNVIVKPIDINPEEKSEPVVPQRENSLLKVNFFIENSGSMKGYVNGNTEYVDVLTNIANHPEIIQNGITRAYYLTSGMSAPVRVSDLRRSLVLASFNQTRSDLNKLFEMALDSTSANSISILISDGIYDMCPDPNPLGTLTILSRELRTTFVEKLQDTDFQTIVVKCNSNFDGRYYPGNCCSPVSINQSRPYYLWIFGDSENLKKYFPDKYLLSLNNHESSARFFKYPDLQDNYRPNSHKKIGTFYPSRNDVNSLDRVKASNGNVFQFSIAVDYSGLTLDNEYLTDKNNYSCSNGYEIVSIDSPTQVSRLGFPNQTHLIVVKKTGNPKGSLTVSLMNKGFPWFSLSSLDDDCSIQGNTTQTFGLKSLNQGIIDAYGFYNNSNEIIKFTISLN